MSESIKARLLRLERSVVMHATLDANRKVIDYGSIERELQSIIEHGLLQFPEPQRASERERAWAELEGYHQPEMEPSV